MNWVVCSTKELGFWSLGDREGFLAGEKHGQMYILDHSGSNVKNEVESWQGKQKEGNEIIRMNQVEDSEGRAVHFPLCCRNSLSSAHVRTHLRTHVPTQRSGHGTSSVN